MAVDASKYLKFAQGPTSTQPDWDRLLDRDLLKAFTSKVAESVGPPGVLRKLDATIAKILIRFTVLWSLAIFINIKNFETDLHSINELRWDINLIKNYSKGQDLTFDFSWLDL